MEPEKRRVLLVEILAFPSCLFYCGLPTISTVMISSAQQKYSHAWHCGVNRDTACYGDLPCLVYSRALAKERVLIQLAGIESKTAPVVLLRLGVVQCCQLNRLTDWLCILCIALNQMHVGWPVTINQISPLWGKDHYLISQEQRPGNCTSN